MEESGVTKMISAKLGQMPSPEDTSYTESAQSELLFEEEEVELEEGRELPPGVDDPSKVSEEDLRPVRARKYKKL
jgi:chromosome segregation protein